MYSVHTLHGSLLLSQTGMHHGALHTFQPDQYVLPGNGSGCVPPSVPNLPAPVSAHQCEVLCKQHLKIRTFPTSAVLRRGSVTSCFQSRNPVSHCKKEKFSDRWILPMVYQNEEQ